MQMFIESWPIYQIQGKEINLFGTGTCTISSSLTRVKWCDFYYQVLRHCENYCFWFFGLFILYINDCQTRLFLHKLCLPALAAKKVWGQYYYTPCKALCFCLFFWNMEILYLGMVLLFSIWSDNVIWKPAITVVIVFSICHYICLHVS